ncbi:hypothetical protein FRC08_000466 [Ceratobasidium sp. 394]|nr:hypothetical protein FRC08_000466 [Ceratobasidium sp. 394]
MVLATSQFVAPPKDGSIPPSLVTDFHLANNPHHIFSVLYDVKSSKKIDVTYEQLAHAAHRAAHLLNPNASIPQGTNLGILATTDTLTYLTIFLGTMRAGLVPFPMSTRTNPQGIAHLCAQTKTTRIVVGGSPAVLELGQTVRSLLIENRHTLELVQPPSFSDLYAHLSQLNPSSLEATEPFPELKPTGNESIVNIQHSSGSTGMPKPISWHQEGVFKNVITQAALQTYRRPGCLVGTMALPPFHTLVSKAYLQKLHGAPHSFQGVMLHIFAPLYLGYTQILFAPSQPPVISTASTTMQAVAGTKCEFLVTAPAFLETWFEDEDALVELRRMSLVVSSHRNPEKNLLKFSKTFGGGPLAQGIGNKLADEGVRLCSGYGATEFGVTGDLYDPNMDLRDWRYVSFATHTDVVFDPQEDEDTYELVVLPSGQRKPYVLNSDYQGQPAYRSKDLVKRHPNKPNLWRFVGRLDDQIILLNEEKTNPGAMEVEILNSSLVQSAIMFGRERNQTGVLIELADPVKRKHEVRENRALLVDQIWPYVERANHISPTHSRLARDAIIFVDPSRPLPRTPKGSIPRSAALKAYQKEIDDMYAALEKDVGVNTFVGIPESWRNLASVQAWVSKCVGHILERDVAISGDFFQQGMDSLTATILLRTLKGAQHSSTDEAIKGVAEKLKQQTVFSNPTIEQLAAFIVRLASGGPSSDDARLPALETIRSMIHKYDSGWESSKRSLEARPEVSKERVLLTGTTGALGSHILAQLLESDRVEKVWALNRKSQDTPTRQSSSFEDKMLDVGLLKSEKLALLDADLEDQTLGLEAEVYKEIMSTATAIIHNAWQVNFNLTLQSFEPSLKGARNLLDLAFRSTASSALPRFLFTSSISAAGFGMPGAHLKEEYVKEEDAANGIGYGQSKFVTEKASSTPPGRLVWKRVWFGSDS